MAFIERDPNSGIYYVGFRISGRRLKRSLETKSEREAETIRSRVEDTLRLIKTGRINVPAESDLATFILSGGKLDKPLQAPKILTLGELFKRYAAEAPPGAKEDHTLYIDLLRTKHFERVLGKSTSVSKVSTESLQRYVNERLTTKTKSGKLLSQVTVKNEVRSIQGIWNRWALPLGLVPFRLSTTGINYPKTRSTAPYQTMEQIEKQIARGVKDDEAARLWGALFLTGTEMAELLQHTREHAAPWLHTLFAIACHTGARRGEMIRAEVDDVNFDAGIIRIREKKADRAKDMTFRTVPLSKYLEGALKDWLQNHPGGTPLLCVKPGVPLTRGEVRYHFERIIKGTKFERVRGSHVLRHSMISVCVSKGIDQRLIDDWVGHRSDAVRQRYRHIYPSASREALDRVFE